jgi:hypothetical protein
LPLLKLRDTLFHAFSFGLKLLEILFQFDGDFFAGNKAPMESRISVKLVAPASTATMVLVSAAPTIFAMTFRSVPMVSTTTAVFFSVHLIPPYYKSISDNL